jgi:hypothetical protein
MRLFSEAAADLAHAHARPHSSSARDGLRLDKHDNVTITIFLKRLETAGGLEPWPVFNRLATKPATPDKQ